MKVAILGYDTEGKVSYEYFAKRGHEVVIHDKNPDVTVPEGVDSKLGENYLDHLDHYDLLVRTPGLSPKLILEKNPGIGDKITSQINEFMKSSPTRNIIGVTGTKGKGTTSTLIAKMLEAAGKKVRLGGNIGIPALSFIDELDAESWVVLELSSFQLIDLKKSPHIAVCLMVAPEHLDWHSDSDEYMIAKSRLFIHQTSDDIAVFYAKNETSKQIASVSPGWKIPYMESPGANVVDDKIVVDDQVVCDVSELKLPGKHNWQNVCAAITAVWKVTQDLEAIRSVVTNFTALPHRLELVRELDSVKYYDDSFGTAPETAMVAVEAFEQPEIVILGGRGKGIPFDELAKTISERSNVKRVIVIGETGAEIAERLRANGFENIVQGAKTIEEIVAQAHGLAEPGDVVILSTACASFDMFKNYKERGEMFSAAVQALA
jgi:UDP-N-acetylmuramoylalanine--D-glutamate ligase